MVNTSAQRWFVGAYYRHTWVPQFMLKPIFERAAGINNHGFGLTASHVSETGLTAELGAGYLPYFFEGAFNPNDSPLEDTEYVESDLRLLHLTGSLLWPIELTQSLRIEIGLGLDVGIVSGRLSRTQAYPEDGAFRPCEGALTPAIARPRTDGDAVPYCEQASDGNDAYYRDRETRVPPVMLLPMLPHVALRFAATDALAIKLEGAFGLAQFWVGASIHLALSHVDGREPTAATLTDTPPVTPPPRAGRIIGKLMDKLTKQPIAHASIKSATVFSALQSDGSGLFVFENLNPGPLHLQIAHPDYPSGTCNAVIPPEGGDVHLHCFLLAPSQVGMIAGTLKDHRGLPIQATVELQGPTTARLSSDGTGAFYLPEAPAGTYRARAEAPGYAGQTLEIQVQPTVTSNVELTLSSAQPALVRREGGSIVALAPLEFGKDGSELDRGGDRLLRDMAELLLHHRDIALLEIQSHTDNQAERGENLALSQVRAETVRSKLVEYGVAPERLRARGWGPDQPIAPNDTPENRARNWRMQFVIERITSPDPSEGTSQ